MKRLGFGGKYEFYWRRHWSSHTLGFPSVCSDSCAKPLNTSLSPPAAMVLLSKPDLDRASHLVSGPFDVDSVLQCISFVFEGSASTIQQGLKFHILQVLQCDNLGASYALYIFHKRTPSPESEMWKSQRFKVYIDRNCFWDFWVWDENTLVILSISESALHLHSKGGKYPNKQSRITFDWSLPYHYKTNFSWLNATQRAQRPWRLILQRGPAIKISFSIWFHKRVDTHLGAVPLVSS